ncbi:Mss4-like protein [Xylariaceae sp. FL0016]|nr:Mss4-like protein [Xylariaceae sp. FL0016]
MTSENPSSAVKSVTAECHCGHVTIEIPSPPTSLNECRCSVCFKYGALWAYYTRKEVMVAVAATDKNVGLRRYARDDEHFGEDSAATMEFCHCSLCGCVTHWWGVGERAGDERKMGVNCRMLSEKQIEGVERKVQYC